MDIKEIDKRRKEKLKYYMNLENEYIEAFERERKEKGNTAKRISSFINSVDKIIRIQNNLSNPKKYFRLSTGMNADKVVGKQSG